MVNPSDIPRLLDTSVFSLFLKPNDTRAPLYLPDLEGKVLAISFVTVGELHRWPIERKWGPKKIQELEDRLRRIVILPYHDAVARNWARIKTSTPKSDNDAWIAACALTYNCILVTDDKDFDGIHGLQIISHADEGRS